MFTGLKYLEDDYGNKIAVYIDSIEQNYREPLKIVCRGANHFACGGATKKIDTIKRVIFNDPATIVFWTDGTKTVVKCQPGDEYDKEKGLALCIAKKYFNNKGNFNKVFKKWIPEENETTTIRKISNTGEVVELSFTVPGDQLTKLTGIINK